MWHARTIKSIISELKTATGQGIAPAEADRRLVTYGQNVLPRGRREHWWNFLFRQFASPLTYILLIAAAVTAWITLTIGDNGGESRGGLTEWVDTIVIMLAVGVNVSVGFWQEFRSNNILEKLMMAVETLAVVVRGGKIREINARYVVPGDLIVLKQGMKVPADARVIEASHLEIDESALTGESNPVGKREGVLSEGTAIHDRTNMIYMGTVVARGEARALVVATGGATEFGKIAALTQGSAEEPTPLQIRMGRLGRLLAVIIGVIAALIFILGILRDLPALVMFKTAIAVAVAAIPEGLPAAISIVLAVASQRILRERGVVKRLVAAETLGSARVICTDKTGTLTEGKMEVEDIYTEGGKGGRERVLEIMALANEVILEEGRDGGILIHGEVTDKAKMEAYLASGGDIHKLLKEFPRVSMLAFDPTRKYLASLHSLSHSDKKHALYLTGAPESVLVLADKYVAADGRARVLTARKRREIEEYYERMAGTGYRIIAAAERGITAGADVPDLEDEFTRKRYIGDLVFVGLAALRDPIRPDVGEAIATAREAGVRTIMLTGDHRLTAIAIGRELGFASGHDAVIEGVEIDQLSAPELARRLRSVAIGARVSPEHKMRIVSALQKEGEVVAMTGDGVNDAPALKAADIGIALNAGTDVAKSASDLILVNNSFSIIVAAIRQGRIAFDNIKKVTVFLLAGSFTELILILAPLLAPLFTREAIPLPLTAVMILWTNLVEDSLPNIALAFEPGESDVMKRPPLARNEPVIDGEAKIIIFAVGIITDIFLFGLFLWLYFKSALSVEMIQTFIFAGLGFDTFLYVYSIKSLRRPLFSYNLASNPYLIVATLIGITVMLGAIYFPPLQLFLGTVALPAASWMVILGLGVLKVLGIELAKWWFFGRKNNAII